MILATWWAQSAQTGGVTYVRCELPARRLPGKFHAGDLPVQIIGEDEAGNSVFPLQEGTAFWSFPQNHTRWLLMNEMMHTGIPCIVEVDDNYLTLPPHLPGYKQHWQLRYTGDPNVPTVEAHVKCAKNTDWVVCSTERLAAEYRRLHPRVSVCRNSVDPADWPVPVKSDVFTIGFAGSASHMHDIADVSRALDWASRQPNVRVVHMGQPRKWSFPVEHLPWTHDLAGYRSQLGMLDVGLCPLRPGLWQDCKSDVKALEYTMAGAMTVVSRTEPYREWWSGLPCLDAQEPKEWLKAVKWCVRNQDEVRRIANEAREHVLANRTIDSEIHAWREAIACAQVERDRNRELIAA